MKAQQRATLGYESTFNISDKLTLNSNLEFSGIWRDTSINAATVEITSNNLINLAKIVQINSPVFSAISPECKIPVTSTQSLTGNCQDTSRPKVRLKAFETNILKDTTLTFDTSRSIASNGIKEMILKVNSEVLSGNSYTFTSSGVYYVEAILIDNQDFKSSIKRKIVVKELYKKDLRAYFRYEVRDEVLSLTYIQNIAKDQISSAKFKVYDQYGATLLEERDLSNVYHLDTAEIEGLSKGTYKVGLEILKTDGELVVYEQDIFVESNLEVSNALPLLDFDLYQSAPKEVFLDARRILDPYHNFKEIIVDWGDEESESFEPDFLIGEKHLYPSIGAYEVKVTGIKENENGEEIIHEVIKEISVTNESVPSLAPIASFYYDVNDQFPYVIFNINLVRSPTSTIENIKFDFGDGQIFEGSAEKFPEIHTHFYDPGVYIATLTATDSEGLSTSLSSRIIVTESGPPLVTDLNCEVIEGKTITCETALVDKYKEIINATINWGDVSTSQLEVINGEWLWDNFDHTYDQFGKYNIEVTVNTIRGQSVTRTLEYELKDEVTPAPSLFLNCDTNYLNLNCNAFTDFENASKLSRIDFYLDDVLVQSGASTSYNYTASENKSVKIYAVGSFGEEGVSTSDFQVLYLIANEAPVADFECYSTEINKVTCSNNSRDDVGISESVWTINSETFNTNTVSYAFDSGGEKEITLLVKDTEGASSYITKIYFIKKNTPPSIDVFECVENEVATVKCRVEASDAEGQSLKFSWYVDGQLHESSLTNLEITDFKKLNAEVEVKVSDSYNDYVSSTKTIEVLPYFVTANFYCEQVENFVLNCSGESSSINAFSEAKYSWKVGGELYSDQKNIQITRDEVGEIEISLEVSLYDGLVKDEMIKLQNFEVMDSLDIPSIGEVLPLIDLSKFINVNTMIQFEISKVSLKELAEGEEFSIVLNDEYLKVNEDYFIVGNIIEIRREFKDGRNKIKFDLKDEDSRALVKDFTFYAGSRDIDYTIMSDDFTDLKVEYLLINDNTTIIKDSLQGPQDSFKNLPNENMAILVKNKFYTTTALLYKDKSDTLTFTLGPNNATANIDNLDFSKGITGWEVIKGEYEIVTTNKDRFGLLKVGDFSTTLTPDSNGEINLSTKVKVTSDEDNASINFPLIFNSSNENSFYFARVTNLQTNESSVLILKMKDIGMTNAVNDFMDNISIAAKNGEEVEFEVFAKYYELPEELTFTEKFINLLTSVSFAGIENLNSIILCNAGYSKYQYDYMNRVYLDDDEGIKVPKNGNSPHSSTVLSGGFNPNHNIKNPTTGQRVIRFKIEVPKNPTLIDAKNLILKTCSVINILCTDLPVFFNYNKSYIEVEMNEHNPTFDSFLRLSLVVKSANNEILSIIPIYTDKNSLLFRPIISLSSNSLYGALDGLLINPNNYSSDRFGRRDLIEGGDSWVSYFHHALFDKLLRSNWAFFWDEVNKSEKVIYLKFNDLAMPGADFDHKDHKEGYSADLRFVEKYEDGLRYSDLRNKRNNLDVHNYQDARAIEQVLNADTLGSNVNEIFVTNENLKEFKNREFFSKNKSDSPFINYLYSSCMFDGVLLSDKVKHSGGHGDHFHLSFYDIDSAGVIKKDNKVNFDNFPIALEFKDQTTFEDRAYYDISETLSESDIVFLESTASYNKNLVYAIPSVETIELPLYISNGKIYASNLYFEEFRKSGGDFQATEDEIRKDNSLWGDISITGKRKIDFRNVRLKIVRTNDYGCGTSYTELSQLGLDVTKLIPKPWLEYKKAAIVTPQPINLIEQKHYKEFEIEVEFDAFFGITSNKSVNIQNDFNKILLQNYDLPEINERNILASELKTVFSSYSIGSEANGELIGYIDLNYIIQNKANQTYSSSLNKPLSRILVCKGAECCGSASIYKNQKCESCPSGLKGSDTTCQNFSYRIDLTNVDYGYWPYLINGEELLFRCTYSYNVVRISPIDSSEFITQYLNSAGVDIFSENKTAIAEYTSLEKYGDIVTINKELGTCNTTTCEKIYGADSCP